MTLTVTEALEKLAAEGDPDRIATYLTEHGHKGGHHTSTCPVASYLRASTGWRVNIAPTIYVVPGAHAVAANLPDVIGQFVRRFDESRYPALEIGGES